MENRSAHLLPLREERDPSPSARLRLVAPTPTFLLPAATVWAELCDGTLRISDRREMQHATLVILAREQPIGPVVQGRRARILERILGGVSENTVAIELGVAASTVSSEIKKSLLGLGLEPRLSAMPLPLVQIYHAAIANGSLAAHGDDPAFTTVVLPRADLALGPLAPQEREVCQLLLAGKTHAEIAAKRGTSRRTVANQLASVFSKLSVSGRLQLVARLASCLAAS